MISFEYRTALSVFIIDDNPADAVLLSRMLTDLTVWDVSPHIYNTAEEAFEELQLAQPDIVFVDFYLGADYGTGVIHRLRLQYPDIACILLTGAGGEQAAVEALRAGAVDYMTKNNLSSESIDHSFRHILGRKQAESELQKFKTLIDQAKYGSVICDENGNIIYLNEAFAEMHGYEVVELVGAPIAELRSNANGESKAKEGFGNSNGNNAGYNGKMIELEHLKKDGEKFPVLVSRTGLEDNGFGEEHTYITETVIDMTELKFMEKQLQNRQKMDSLGTLAGGIAHDFNNIMQGIIGGISRLSSDTEHLSDMDREQLTRMTKAANRAKTLIRQLQTISHKSEVEKGCVDLYDIAEEVMSLIDNTTDKMIEKRLIIEPGKFYINAFQSQIHQVLLNLATNSVKAIHEQGIMSDSFVELSADICENVKTMGETHKLPDGSYIHVMFRDNGVGMDEHIRKKIFEPMFTTRGKEKSGQGLGLAMVYKIIENHDGIIEVESEKGKGTIFHIYFSQATPSKTVTTETEVQVVGGNETVLVIDDEIFISEYAADILRECGYDVYEANDGQTGLDLYREHSGEIDIVLLDLTMPKMSGQMVLQHLIDITPQVKVVIASGQSEDDIRNVLDNGARGFVAKPFEEHELAQIVRTVLDL